MTYGRPAKIVGERNSLEPGFWVLMMLDANIAPWPTLIGEIQAVDGYGVRITRMDRQTKKAEGWDAMIPHDYILSVPMVGTPDHDLELFKIEAEEIEAQYSGLYGDGDEDDDGGISLPKQVQ